MTSGFTGPQGYGSDPFEEFFARFFGSGPRPGPRHIDIGRLMSRPARQLVATAATYATEHGSTDLDMTIRRLQAFEKAGEAYTKALELATETSMKYSYALALAGVHTRLDEPMAAIAAYQEALDLSPNSSESWKIEESIALLHSQNGNHSDALAHAQKALALAPEDQKQRLQALVSQLDGQQ